LKGLPDIVNAVWPATILIHLIRNSFRFASRKSWNQLSRHLKPIYTAINAEAAAAALDDLGANGAPVIRRSSGSGAAHGKSSSRSWTTTWHNEASFSAAVDPAR
jgi:Transposase, Mutator family